MQEQVDTSVNSDIATYNTSFPPDIENAKQCGATPGCRSYHVNKFIVEDFEKVLPVTRSSMTRDRLPQTSAFGLPFRQRGDGQLFLPDASNDVRFPKTQFEHECDRALAEVPYDRWHCVSFPLAWQSWKSVDSRQGVQVFRCNK
jgi:hypothetical protein